VIVRRHYDEKLGCWEIGLGESMSNHLGEGFF